MSIVRGSVLVTGATGGLGDAIARAFSAQGATLVLTGRRVEALESLARELGARAIACDLSDRHELDRVIGEVGEVDVLVANAAVPASGRLSELTEEQIDRMLEVNLRAPVALARGFAPGMMSRRRGHIVFISSQSGKAAQPASSVYSATKFGLRGFALGLRADLRPHGVGVSVVLPGFIRGAGMFADARIALPFYVGTRTPEDVATAVIRAVERNRAEIDVAPPSLRVGTAFASIAPQMAETVSRWMGNDRIATRLAERQRDKR